MDSKNAHHPVFTEWSDRKCLYIASQDRFPAAVKDLNIQKSIISRYLNFYLGGKIQKGLSPRDLTLAVIAIMPISSSSEEFIWPESDYGENGNLFFLTPDDKLIYDINKLFEKRTVENDKEDENLNDEPVPNQVNPDVEPSMYDENGDVTDDNYSDTAHSLEINVKAKEEDTAKETSDHREVDQENDTSKASSSKLMSSGITVLSWYRPKHIQTTNITSTDNTKYGPVENAKFCMLCNHLLDNWDVSVRDRISLKYFFAMVALFVMRSKAKTFQTVSKYFSNKIDGLCPYTTPHRGFLKKSWKAFRETAHSNRIMFAKLVITSLLHPTRLETHKKKNIVRYAILSHTAYYGMGIISLLQQVASFFNGDSFKVLFESLYSEETAVSWNRVNDFFKKYLNEDAKQHTFHWAGVIDSESFKHLSCSNNYELAVVIAVYIEKITMKSGVWESSWVAKGDLEKCKQLGYKMYDNYQEIKKELDTSVSVLDLDLEELILDFNNTTSEEFETSVSVLDLDLDLEELILDFNNTTSEECDFWF